jgi:hypothetical protein
MLNVVCFVACVITEKYCNTFHLLTVSHVQLISTRVVKISNSNFIRR